MGKELRGKGPQRLHVCLHIGKEVVGDVGLQGRGPGQGIVEHAGHGLLRDRSDGGLLLHARLLHDLGQVLLLIEIKGGIEADEDGDDEQHKIEDLLMQPADPDPVDDFHSTVRMSEKPVTSKISMMVSFTWVSFIVP